MIDPNAGSSSVASSNPAFVYDGGPQQVLTARYSAVINAAGPTVIPLVSGKRIKLLGATVTVPVGGFTTGGSLDVIDGVTNFFTLCTITAAGQTFIHQPTGVVMATMGLSFNLLLYYSGNATITASLVYYTAP